MLQISIASDADRLLDTIGKLRKDKLPRALMDAANELGAVVNTILKREIEGAFDRPTPLTLRAIDYRRATIDRPQVDIWIKRDGKNASATPAKYLHAEMAGGGRKHKAYEIALINGGHMPANMYAMPGSGVYRDGYGNIPGSLIRRMIVGLRYYEGDKKKRRRTGARATNYFFSVKVGEPSHLKPGIYWHANQIIIPFFIFTRAPTYPKRYDFLGKGEEVYVRYRDKIVTKHLQRILSR